MVTPVDTPEPSLFRPSSGLMPTKPSRDDRIRTCGPFVPNEVRYQAALHPDGSDSRVKMTAVLKPDWLRVKAPQRERIGAVADMLLDLKLNTVCQEASCPNIGECFAGGTATFLIMGPGCTRACPYCDIDFDKSVRQLDPTEPERLGEAVARLGLKHVVITSVNRDDLEDGGASQFVACIEQVKQRSPLTTIELLIPDFCGNWDALATVMEAAPHVLNHNIETVPRLYRQARPQGIYERSLELLQRVREGWPKAYSKSGLMVGLGENDAEVIDVLRDLRAHQVDIVTIGQYLSPGPKHLAVDRFVTPEQFDSYREVGERSWASFRW